MNFKYSIEGMHCESCIEKINATLSSKVKIIDISFNPAQLQIEAVTPPRLDELNASLSAVGPYHLNPLNEDLAQPFSVHHEADKKGIWVYYPIFLITFYIVGIAFLNNFHNQEINWQGWMNQFMAGFFLVFSAFKLLDIRGFAEGYATYDLLARHWYTYGFIYPFLELGLGILYLGRWFPIITPLLTVIIMGFSSFGVINSLLKKQKLKCACLGTILNVPLSSITLIEDLTMVGLAMLVLLFG